MHMFNDLWLAMMVSRLVVNPYQYVAGCSGCSRSTSRSCVQGNCSNLSHGLE